jgi:hypothetical protein
MEISLPRIKLSIFRKRLKKHKNFLIDILSKPHKDPKREKSKNPPPKISITQQ